jgi:hypothetical protein
VVNAPVAIPPAEIPDTQLTGESLVLGASLDWCGKSRPPPGFEFRIVQPITIRYTDCVSVIDTVFHKRLDSSMSTMSGGPRFNAGEGRRFFSSFTSAKPPVVGVPGALYFLKLNTDHHIHLRGTFKMFPESFYF